MRLSWDVPQDNVELYILTKPFAGGKDFKRYMHKWAHKAFHSRAPPHGNASQGKPAAAAGGNLPPAAAGLPTPLFEANATEFDAARYPHVYVIHHHVADGDIPR